MNAIIGITIVLINVLIGLVNIERGLKLYIILSIICPVIDILGMSISYEIMFFFPMLLLFMMTGSKGRIKKQGKYLIAYFVIFIVATLMSNLLHEASNELVSIFGIGRMVILYLMFTAKTNLKEFYAGILQVCLYANVVCMLLQITMPNALNIFYELYAKESATAIGGFSIVGRFTRLTGSFNNSAPAGFFFLIVLATYLVEYSKENTVKNMSVLVMAILCGLATATKTFLIGMPILLIANVALSIVFKNRERLGKRKMVDLKKLILIMATVIGIVLFFKYTEGILYTNNYIENLSISNIFSSRYSSEAGGNLVYTMSVFKENWLLGVGATTLIGEFVGDSLYVTLLHNTGILGFLLITVVIIGLLKENIINSNRQNLLLILSVLMCGFAVPTVFNFFGILTLAFVTVNTNTKSIEFDYYELNKLNEGNRLPAHIAVR